MTYPAYVREKARTLRRERKLTIDQIAECLAISRTTAYSWVADIPIPESERALAGRARGRRRASRRMSEKHAALRAAAYERGWREYPSLVLQPTFSDFICLYIAEGTKRCRNVVAFCNSSAGVILVGNKWIRELAENPVRYWIQYHADQDLPALQHHWARVVGVAPDEIQHQRKSNSGNLAGRHWRSPHGVLTVRTSDTSLRMRLQAWMDRTHQGWLDSLRHGV